ncbi:MAG: type secretion protein Rhs [Alphaproteobacteria bacterium]|nr:type secretion protein Rhs [Alphaproteobacteria bacterium]
MKIRHNLLAALFLLLSGCAATVAAPSASAPAAGHVQPAELKAGWWRDNRWRYHDDAEADAAYGRLLASQSPWPEWHQAQVVSLPVGLRFEMALAPGQPPDRPGAFGTFDRIPDARFVRFSLAVKTAWKPKIDRIVTFEVADPLPADVGMVGPQIDGDAGLYLPGGASQLEMKVPAPERMAHLKIVAVRPIP